MSEAPPRWVRDLEGSQHFSLCSCSLRALVRLLPTGQRTEIGSGCRCQGVPHGGGTASPGQCLYDVLGCSSCLLHMEPSMSLISSLLQFCFWRAEINVAYPCTAPGEPQPNGARVQAWSVADQNQLSGGFSHLQFASQIMFCSSTFWGGWGSREGGWWLGAGAGRV